MGDQFCQFVLLLKRLFSSCCYFATALESIKAYFMSLRKSSSIQKLAQATASRKSNQQEGETEEGSALAFAIV